MIVDPLRHPDRDAAQLLADAHLAAQPGGLGEPEGQVQHVQLLVRRLVRQPVKVLLRQDDVAGGAGQGALARTEPARRPAEAEEHELPAVANGERTEQV